MILTRATLPVDVPAVHVCRTYVCTYVCMYMLILNFSIDTVSLACVRAYLAARTISIEVDPEGLTPGAHFAEVTCTCTHTHARTHTCTHTHTHTHTRTHAHTHTHTHTQTQTWGRTFLINKRYSNKEMESFKTVVAYMLGETWYNSFICSRLTYVRTCVCDGVARLK